jgi:hypothetical protein
MPDGANPSRSNFAAVASFEKNLNYVSWFTLKPCRRPTGFLQPIFRAKVLPHRVRLEFFEGFARVGRVAHCYRPARNAELFVSDFICTSIIHQSSFLDYFRTPCISPNSAR